MAQWTCPSPSLEAAVMRARAQAPLVLARADGRPDQTSRVHRRYTEESERIIPVASRRKKVPGVGVELRRCIVRTDGAQQK